MRYDRYVCIIVDGFSTGKKLAPDFISKGYPCIHIQSSPDLPADKFSHLKTDFVNSFVYNGKLDELLTELSTYGFKAKVCVPGSESGVELADLISEKLGLPTNGTFCSEARRNKYLMIETVSAAGLKTVKHFKSTDPNAIIEWVKREVSQYPIVLKPLESANGDGVFFCKDEQEVKEAHQKILSSPNVFGQKNAEVLAESFNYGQEYIVNTVSCKGREGDATTHFVAEIWHTFRKPGTTVYDKAEIVSPTEKEYALLSAYTFKVLDALQIKIGAATTELKYTPDGGPVLIETAARIMGGAPLSLSNELFGYTQLSLTAMAYINPNTFLSFTSLSRAPIEQFAMDVMLISDTEGEITTAIDTSEIKKLESLHSFIIINKNEGARLEITIDSTTSPGEIFLCSHNREELYKAYLLIRKLEAAGLYRKATMKPANVSDNPAGFFSTPPSLTGIPTTTIPPQSALEY